ncbi:MAG: RNase adapter RapZ [Gammaproteobacteria bacterium]|nr:RNase adapter RapZ [Gammaproteobacteria bacterium]NNF62445.1 RNase adapter RapZ [Gammaproteobacteria bacterium]NNM21392.1 RNase adapter RapZ [Gammaproteobacteria bacterium]
MRLIIVSGLSGSGKSVALHMLEDLGYYCIDNIPIALLKSFVDATVKTELDTYQRTAVGVDARNRPANLDQLPELINQLKNDGIQCEVLFLHSDPATLMRRYRETRRRHPLSRTGMGLQQAIDEETRLLEPVATEADLVIDTSNTSIHELRELIRERVAARRESQMSLQFQSFGYKNGLPADADIVFDVRCLPNPYWVAALRDLTGRDQPVAEWLAGQSEVTDMLESISTYLRRWIPEFLRSNRSYLTVAVGCTGGQHRSVYLAERLAEEFRNASGQVQVRHSSLSD